MGRAIAKPIKHNMTYHLKMTNYRRYRLDGGTYFFTVNLAERQRNLLTERIDSLRDAFRVVKNAHPFVIDAVVVLPEHLHTIWTLPQGDMDKM